MGAQQVSTQEGVLSTREAQIRQREQELVDQARELNDQQRSMACREEELAQMEQAVSSFAQNGMDFKEQRQEVEQQLEFLRQELERQTSKNRCLQQTVQEQKNLLFDLERQLHQEQTIANLITPGEYIKLVKKHEGESFAHQNSELKLKNRGLEMEIQEVHWHNEVMRNNLPRAAWESVAKELHSQPLP